MEKHFSGISEEHVPEVARAIMHMLGDRKLILFFGEPGAGKTTLIKSLCALLEVSDVPSSPTFAIVQVYASSKGDICHADLYRVRDISELEEIGFAEQMEKAALTCIEWPELILPYLDGKSNLRVYLSVSHDNKRNIILEA